VGIEMKETALYYCEKIKDIPVFIPKGRRVVVLADKRLESVFIEIFPYPVITVDSTEDNKCFETIENLTIKLMDAGADRGTLLLIAGGGIVGDMGGFLASVYYRGIDFGIIPTTLLSQVDSSIGGKTAINVKGFKNILGMFNPANFTIFCSEFLDTLPRKQIDEGLAEMLKTFLLADKTTYLDAVDIIIGGNPHLKKLSSFSELFPFIKRATEIKSEIVKRDPFEKGERKLLNLGHTFGHALEKLCGISHGEGVSIGIALCTQLSVKLRLLPKSEGNKIIRDLDALGLPFTSPVPPKELVEIMTKDKKKDGEAIQFILLEGIGKAVIYPLTIERLKGLLNDLS
jgi:3-dehydroquinate synthase